MHISFASEQGQGRSNEDRAGAGAEWALVIDGATEPPGVETGCRHGVSWLVDRLAGALAGELSAERPAPLADCLAGALESVRRAHGGACDLDNPDSPSATVAVARPLPAPPAIPNGVSAGARRLEYLVLADCTVLLAEGAGAITAVTDDRVEHLPGGRPYSAELVRNHRNADGGFWVAGAVPEAAYRAVTGSSHRACARFAPLTAAASGSPSNTATRGERSGTDWRPKAPGRSSPGYAPKSSGSACPAESATTTRPHSSAGSAERRGNERRRERLQAAA